MHLNICLLICVHKIYLRYKIKLREFVVTNIEFHITIF